MKKTKQLREGKKPAVARKLRERRVKESLGMVMTEALRRVGRRSRQSFQRTRSRTRNQGEFLHSDPGIARLGSALLAKYKAAATDKWKQFLDMGQPCALRCIKGGQSLWRAKEKKQGSLTRFPKALG